jgi:hypothetical protein
MISLREVRFLVCTIAVLMIYKLVGTNWLMNVLAVNALINLFSGQHLCATGSCGVEKPDFIIPFLPFKVALFSNPIAILHYITTTVGLLFFLYGTVKIWG